MSTTAIVGNQTGCQCPSCIMPREKSPREIIREEIKREKKLEELEQKHDAGEISDFEYNVQKFILNMPEITPYKSANHQPGTCFSTTA